MAPDAPGRGAMGLRLVGDPVPGLHPGVAPGAPALRVARAAAAPAEGPSRGGTALLRRSWPDGRAFLRVERLEDGGLRAWADGFGSLVLDAAGRALRWAPPPGGAPAAERRLLFSQGLPMAATLRGLEVLHAGAVRLEGRLVAVAAGSGTGKSSTLAHLVAAGAAPFADDVLAVEPSESGVRAHAGPRLANVPRAQLAALGARGARQLGRELGETDKVHLEPPGADPPAGRLDLLVLLERGRPGAEPADGPVDGLASRLLACGYVAHLDAPDRLERQLDVAARVARGVAVRRVVVGHREGAAAVAARVAGLAAEAAG